MSESVRSTRLRSSLEVPELKTSGAGYGPYHNPEEAPKGSSWPQRHRLSRGVLASDARARCSHDCR